MIKIVIYLDIIFLENLIMNVIIIYSTGILIKIKPKFIRTIISSGVGSIYSILLYITELEIYTSIISKIILSIIMVYIAYNPKSVAKMWKQVLIFYMTSFIFGGVSLYLIYFLKPKDILIKNGVFVGEYMLKVIFLGGIFGFIIVKLSTKIIKTKFTSKDMHCKIKIKLNDKEIETKAILDTGNLVKEPITNTPVVIVEKNILYNVVPKEILDNIENILKGNLNKISERIQIEYIPKLRYIPFKSLGKENGILLGIKADEIEVEMDGDTKKSKNIIIGIYERKLSKKGEYYALLGIEFL